MRMTVENNLKDIGIITALVGLVGKISWDWLKAGRVREGVYVKITDCEKNLATKANMNVCKMLHASVDKTNSEINTTIKEIQSHSVDQLIAITSIKASIEAIQKSLKKMEDKE